MFNKLIVGAMTFALLLTPLAPSVSAAVGAAVVSANPIANASVEDGTPTGWTQSSWTSGTTNKPVFEHVAEGHTGNKSIKVTMSDYSTDGDAEWIFDPIPTTVLEPGKQYRFTNWYKTNTLPKAVAMYNMADGTQKYFGMPNAQPPAAAATTWQKFSDTFTVPQGAVSVSVFMFLDRNGWVQTDDYSIESYTPTGFNEALVTLTFDDGHEDNVANGLPVLEQNGFKSTQCFATEFIEGVGSQAQDNVMAFYNKGHEICSHTVSHPQLTTVDQTQLNHELQHPKDYLESVIGRSVPNFASPYGDYNEQVNNVIKGIYQSHRTVDEGFNSKDNFDQYRLRVQNITVTTTAAQVQAWVEQAKADKTWLILVYHRVVDPTKPGVEAPGQFDSTLTDFIAQMNVIKQSGVTVKTYQDALTDTLSQLGTNPTPTPTPTPITKVGDVNNDNVVDGLDLSTVLTNWNKPGTRAQGNLNNDELIDGLDLSIVLTNWSK